MINNIYGTYIPTCDGCGEELQELEDFYDAIAEIKRNGWLTARYKGDFAHYCPECAEKIKEAPQ